MGHPTGRESVPHLCPTLMSSGGLRPRHLLRRGAVYAVRFRIPADLAAKLGMVVLQKSLHTKDFGEAKRRCQTATTWFQAAMRQLRVMASPTKSDLEDAARAFFEKLRGDIDQPRNFPREEPDPADI